MSETFEELVTNHTRRELEEMAMKLGVEALGGTKSQLAESILDASRKATPKNVAEPVSWEHPREATPTVEKPKAAAKAQILGKTGVMAKISAANKTAGELEKAGKEIREEGIRKMTNGIAEFNKGVDSQVKENKEAVAMINSGVRDIQAASEIKCPERARKMQDLREVQGDGGGRFQEIKGRPIPVQERPRRRRERIKQEVCDKAQCWSQGDPYIYEKDVWRVPEGWQRDSGGGLQKLAERLGRVRKERPLTGEGEPKSRIENRLRCRRASGEDQELPGRDPQVPGAGFEELRKRFLLRVNPSRYFYSNLDFTEGAK